MLRPAILLAMGLPFLTGSAEAQNVVLDQGTFVHSRNGASVGTETFSIRRSGTGDNARVIATAQVRLDLPEGELNLDPALEAAGRGLTVAAYQVKVSGRQREEIAMSLSDSRFVTRIRSDRGEQVREFRATSSTVILDDGVAHQYFFLHARLQGQPGPLQVIVPRRGRHFRTQVEVRGSEEIVLGGQTLQARHLVLQGDGVERHVWMDEDGRVLRVVHGDGSFRAEREAPPG